ncbi:tyrosine-type recombinase/integrase [Winogradskyella pulchriflava]|uniref:Tyrosine-type recombinase/integrase n=1 Tax=Winogradskyella pulchriflava TaxID=1110688 RepID=A0ABV6QA82_9FLAO
MSSIFLLLQKVHENVHVLSMKTNYSEPKIYTGGVDINQWSKLTKSEQTKALNKDWYVHYSFRHPESGRLIRQTNIKAGANRFKDKRSRYHILKVIKQSLEIILSEGFNPYEDNANLKQYLEERLDNKQRTKNSSKSENITTKLKVKPNDKFETNVNLKEAFELVLKLKENVMTHDSFVKYRSRINKFNTWLLNNGFNTKSDIRSIQKKTVITYLNQRLEDTGVRNRNNARTDLSSFFQTLKDNDITAQNFIKEINILKATPKRNKSFSPKQENEIFSYLEKSDKTLLLFIKFICYALLRPIEICRLKIKDIDIPDKKLYVVAKNQPVKIKIIPEILLKEIPSLKDFDPNHPLFSKDSLGQEWSVKESSRKDYYTKQFKAVKDNFNLNSDYGLYSFRHTYIAKMYKKLARESSPHKAKSDLMLITGHTSMSGLENYLRSIDAQLPKDYSNLLK